MYLVDDIHAVPEFGGHINDFFFQVTDVVHTVIGRGVHFNDIGRRARVNGAAGGTLVTGVPVYRVQTVDRLRQNLRRRRLPCPPGTAEKVSVRNLARRHLIF